MKIYSLLFCTLLLTACVTPDEDSVIDVSLNELNDYWLVNNEGRLIFDAEKLSGINKDGWVELEYLIDSEGNVSNVKIVQSDQDGLWNEIALAGISNLSYRAAESNPERQAIKIKRRFQFKAVN